MDIKIVSELCFKSDETGSGSSSSDSDVSPRWSSSDSDSIFDERIKRTKVEGFMEDIVPKYSDLQFKSHFRLQRKTVDFVETLLCDEFKTQEGHTGGRKHVSSKTAVHLFLWYIANQETFRQIADRFNVSEKTAHVMVNKVSKLLMDNSVNFIVFPEKRKFSDIAEGFKKKKNLGGVIGAIDGSHIRIRCPKINETDYVCRKKYHSIIIQAICDHNLRFLDIYVGEPGSLHDARVLRKSPFFRYMHDNPNHLENYFLLGDSAYPLLSWLVTPYKDNGRLTVEQRRFNYLHSGTRVVIENAFGSLKGRFRRLKNFDNLSIKFIVQCIIAACVLHNICLQFGDEGEDMLEVENDSNDIVDAIPQEEIHNFPGAQIDKRQELFNSIFNSE